MNWYCKLDLTEALAKRVRLWLLVNISHRCLLLFWAQVQFQGLEAKPTVQIPFAIGSLLQDTGRTWLFLLQSGFPRLDSLGRDYNEKWGDWLPLDPPCRFGSSVQLSDPPGSFWVCWASPGFSGKLLDPLQHILGQSRNFYKLLGPNHWRLKNPWGCWNIGECLCKLVRHAIKISLDALNTMQHFYYLHAEFHLERIHRLKNSQTFSIAWYSF